jgi:hypothetical protein
MQRFQERSGYYWRPSREVLRDAWEQLEKTSRLLVELAGVPFNLVMIQVLLKIEACRIWGRLGTTRGDLQDYLEHCTRLQSTRGLVDRASLGPPTHCRPYTGDEFLYIWTIWLVGHGDGTVDHKAGRERLCIAGAMGSSAAAAARHANRRWGPHISRIFKSYNS